MRKRVLVFAFHDVNKIIDVHVLNYLYKIKTYFHFLIFVSDHRLSEEQKRKISFFDKILDNKHFEKDFGSWKRGLKSILNKCKYDEIFLLNDSVIGPTISFKDILIKMDKKKSDFWGITSAGELDTFHIQSYFLCFKKKCFTSDVFINFFNSVQSLKNKADMVREYEIGLTQKLIKNNFLCISFVNSFRRDIYAQQKSFKLMKSKVIPFLKVKTFVNNPEQLPNVFQLFYLVEDIKEFKEYILRVNNSNTEKHLYYKLPLLNLKFISKKFLHIRSKISKSQKWWRFYVKFLSIYIFFIAIPLFRDRTKLYNAWNVKN